MCNVIKQCDTDKLNRKEKNRTLECAYISKNSNENVYEHGSKIIKTQFLVCVFANFEKKFFILAAVFS